MTEDGERWTAPYLSRCWRTMCCCGTETHLFLRQFGTYRCILQNFCRYFYLFPKVTSSVKALRGFLFQRIPLVLHAWSKLYMHKSSRLADLQPGNYFFAGPRFIVSASRLAKTIKRTAERMGLPANRLSNHSIRIGGLVSLFAAEVPDNLKQLAGRWASADSFIAYARASMQQFTTIASALNRVDLVSPEHVRRFYM